MAVSCQSVPVSHATLPPHNSKPFSINTILNSSHLLLDGDSRPHIQHPTPLLEHRVSVCLLPVRYPVLFKYTAKVRGSWVACQEGEEQFSLLVYMLWLCTYFPVSMEERDGQHIGVVTKALMKDAPPFSIIRLVLFMTCKDPAISGTDYHSAAKSSWNVLDATLPLKAEYQRWPFFQTSVSITP